MFDIIKDNIKRGRYADAYNYAQEEKLHLHYLRSRSIPRPERADDYEAWQEYNEKFYGDPTFNQKYKILNKLTDLIFNTYIVDSKKTSVTYNGEQGELLTLPEIDIKRDRAIIEQIEALESEALNIEGWNYDEKISEKFRRLVNECKTNDEKYISQLSLLIQAIEDEYSPILLLGETGVGKSQLASIFHSFSKRADKNFVELNCARLTEENIDTILFGAEKGSYTGSIKALPGKISEADGGTLFLDEIDRTTQRVRDILLTFIDTKRFQRLGSEKDEGADICILFGSNKDPKTLVNENLLESDFYRRITKRVIHIPPLRDRKDDIKLIADFCLERFNNKYGTDIKITNESYELLKSFPWPGNFGDLNEYLEFILSKCKWKPEKYLTPYLMNKIPPPDQILETSESEFEIFENLMSKFLSGWDLEKGKFTDEFILPILAKIYKDDFSVGKNQTEKNELAMSIVGMDGKSKRGSLATNYLKYQKLKSQFTK